MYTPEINDKVWLDGLINPRWLPVIGNYRNTQVLVEFESGEEKWFSNSKILMLDRRKE